MSVTKRGSSWQVRWRNASGKRCTKTFSKKVLAEEYERKQRGLAYSGEVYDPTNARITVAELYPTWITTKGSLKEKTLLGYESTWRNIVAPKWGDVQVRNITFGQVKAWHATCTSISGKKLGPTKSREAYYVLSMILDHAVENGYLPRNPAKSLNGSGQRFLRKADGGGSRNFLRQDELRAVANASGAYRDLVLLLGTVGLRFNEACGLKGEDIDLVGNKIHVRRTLSDLNGRFIEQLPKNGKIREVHLPEFLRAQLAERKLAAGDSGYVFTTPDGSITRHSNFSRRVWHPALQVAGIKKRVTIHDLRHTAASWLVDQGVNIMELCRMLGHSDASITLKLYGHLYDEDLKRLGRAMDQAGRVFA
jgi:integrase